jgi:uncharacterized protein (DUF697 family)/tellurite resistance protein
MIPQDQRAILAVALLAARADGVRSEAERDAVHRASARLRSEGVDLDGLYDQIDSGRLDLARASSELTSSDARALAYEVATCVCDADGASTAAERAFLEELAAALGLDAAQATRFRGEADAIASAPLASSGAAASAAAGAVAPPTSSSGAGAIASAAPSARVDEAEIDRLILNQAILCGGLELLPHTLAMLSILPLQMRLVYQIGKRYGYELDRGHVKDFLATAGVSMVSHAIEGFALNLIGGFMRRSLGGFLGGMAGRALRPALAFGTTYALGHAAKRYYAGGRKLSAIQLRDLFGGFLSQSKGVQAQHTGDIQRQAGAVDLGALRSLVGGR